MWTKQAVDVVAAARVFTGWVRATAPGPGMLNYIDPMVPNNATQTNHDKDAKTLLIGTDPVAIDRLELEIVEQKRREVGAPSLFDRNPANLGRSSDIERTAQKNPFYREPNHIRTASELGLGTWDLAKIDRRKIVVS